MPVSTGRAPAGDLWSLLEWRASLTPDAEACVDRVGRRLTFAELYLAAASQAGGLARLGMRAGDTVVWELPTSLDAAILTLALRRLGVRQVPVIAIYRDREVRHCCAETGASWLLTGGPFRGFDFDDMGDRISEELGLRHLTTQSLPSGGLDQSLASVADPDADLWVFYTSGTTAAPKGARHCDRTLARIGSAMAGALRLEPSDRYALVFPFPHVGGIVLLFSGIIAGCCHLLDEAFDPQQTPAFLAAEGVTHAGTGTPFHLAYLEAQRQQPDRTLFPRLKCCPGGAAPKPPTLHEQVKHELGGVGIVSSWGLTEAPILTFADFGDPDEKLATTEGRPLPGVELRTVRPDGTAIATDAEGELQVRGPHVMAGYVDSALDQEVFTSDGWFRTGDLGIIDGRGYVRITGRMKDVIIRNGENVSAKEVEDLLFGHPKVADVSVIGVPDSATGERVCAVVVATHPRNRWSSTRWPPICAPSGCGPKPSPSAWSISACCPGTRPERSRRISCGSRSYSGFSHERLDLPDKRGGNMRADNMILISVDDHIAEPADMFERHVPKRYKDLAPRVVTDEHGRQQWWYGEKMGRNLGLNAVAGKPREMYNVNPASYGEMRSGCFDVHERVRDMSAGGTLAALNFPNWTGFSGQVLNEGPDRHLNEVMIKAYNDWHVDEWCALYPDRFIPCGILPLFDVERAAAEVRRLASKGCHAATFSENPAALDMPSIHSGHWDPLFAACSDEGTVLCLHVGSSSKVARTTVDAPVSVPMSLSSLMSIYSLGDLMWADFWWRFPELRFSLTEGDIGWIPYFLQRAEHVHDRHSGWTGQTFPDGYGPAEVFRERVICCFINDPVGLSLLDHFNIDNLCWESDFPHSDSTWPNGPEVNEVQFARLTDEQINKITHENAIRHFSFDPFSVRSREQCTVAALRAEAPDVDTVTRVGRPPDQSDRDFFRSFNPIPAAGRSQA